MPIEPPKLDDRTFQDIVDDAKRKLQRLGIDWTDHNVSDPGVMLIELFAWMTDMLLFRLNRVPERNQIALLNLLGVSLEPPRAATTELTFRMRTPEVALAGGLLRVPAGTEVATPQRSGDAAQIRFSTDIDLDIRQRAKRRREFHHWESGIPGRACRRAGIRMHRGRRQWNQSRSSATELGSIVR